MEVRHGIGRFIGFACEEGFLGFIYRYFIDYYLFWFEKINQTRLVKVSILKALRLAAKNIDDMVISIVMTSQHIYSILKKVSLI